MAERHVSPESIRQWAKNIWPCSLPDHDPDLVRDGWCGGCGRARCRSLLESPVRGPIQGTWEHDGVLVAIVAGGMLYVHQESYEKALEG